MNLRPASGIGGGVEIVAAGAASETPIVETDTGDFSALYRDARLTMVRIAVGIVRDPGVAEEVVQEAFASVLRKWRRMDRPEAYLRRCVVNGSLKAASRRRRVDLRAVPETAMETADRDLLDAVAALPVRRRTVVVLRFYGGWTETDIAAAMGIRPGTVKSTLHAALAELRETIER
jgi:RNA polymerase sigma factor (sigma-70 family)